MKYINTFLLILLLMIIGCGDTDPEPTVEPGLPSSVTLIFPFENSECNDGIDITENESTILFEWFSSDFTDEYELNVINLNNDNRIVATTSDTKVPVTLLRATPYAWFVVSRSGESDSTATSEVWKFYNAGDGIESYAPFPAEIISPAMAQVIDAPSGQITLSWEGTDIDDDIIGYDIFFGTESEPILFEENISTTSLEVVVNPGTTYYWKVVTRDETGHTSQTAVHQFRVE